MAEQREVAPPESGRSRYLGDLDPRSRDVRLSGVAARAAYAALFTIVLPVALIFWSRRLDQLLTLPRLHWPAVGVVVTVAGIALATWAMLALWIEAGGLPASAFPPARLATGGPYALVPHPIYVGAVAVCVGIALASGSPAGLWIVSPVLAGSAFSWVRGYENSLTRTLFGTLPAPRIRLPDDTSEAPSAWNRVSCYVLVLIPWVTVYLGISALGGPARDFVSSALPFEHALPIVPWTEVIYASAYLVVGVAPLLAHTRHHLRVFALDALASMAIVFPLYLLLPIGFAAREVPSSGGVLEWMMQLERTYDSAAAAFPAYHVVWPFIAAQLYGARWQLGRRAFQLVAVAIAASCTATGMHGVLDVTAGFVVYLIVAHRGRVWRAILRAAERVANSWREWTVAGGRIRLLNHGIYAGVGTALGVALQLALVGGDRATQVWAVALVTAAIGGAGLWAQLVEGSPQLLRPYGYYGAVFGVAIVAVAAGVNGADAWLLVTSFGIGTTVAYAWGRLRCLVQGCCHGVLAPRETGIVYTHPRSRVVRLSAFGGQPLHATPLYSLCWSLVLCLVLLRLWRVGAPLSFIAGTYFILAGLCRFVEEHYRGEPQTLVIGGLRLYQWLAIASVIAGAALTAFATRPAPPIAGFGPEVLPILLVVGAFAFVAYGVDFPRSNRRYSRLV